VAQSTNEKTTDPGPRFQGVRQDHEFPAGKGLSEIFGVRRCCDSVVQDKPSPELDRQLGFRTVLRDGWMLPARSDISQRDLNMIISEAIQKVDG